jgi:hypothetical protein
MSRLAPGWKGWLVADRENSGGAFRARSNVHLVPSTLLTAMLSTPRVLRFRPAVTRLRRKFLYLRFPFPLDGPLRRSITPEAISCEAVPLKATSNRTNTGVRIVSAFHLFISKAIAVTGPKRGVSRFFGIIELRRNSRQIFGFKGLICKILPNKDLAHWCRGACL